MKVLRLSYISCRFRAGQRAELGLSTIGDSRTAHVISANVGTGSRSVLRLKDVNAKNMRFKYGGVLPEKAILGLWNALKSCSLIPKMIQLEADQLKEKLSQRQFPASPEEVQEARLKIREALEAESGLPAQNAVNQKVEEAYERELKKKVDKMLRHTRYNWKPLDFKTREQAAAYTLARIAPNHAEVRFVLQELERVKYVPQTVLDYGSGSGAAFWAAFEQWGKKVASYQLIDPNEEISQFCMDILRGDGENDGHAFVHPDITFRRFLAPSLSNTFDVIIVHRVLAEVASKESRIDLITNLWRRTNRYLVLIEGCSRAGFDALMEARDCILIGGCELHREQTRQILAQANAMNEEAESVLSDQQLPNYIRYNLIKNMLPPNTVLATRLEPGYVYAPCPHDQGCPKVVEKTRDVCSFSTQWNVLRADGRKQVFNTETGAFSYVIMAKGARERSTPSSRILTCKRGDRHVCCTICTPFSGIQRFTTSRSMGRIYKTIKNVTAGQLLPVQVSALGSDSEFDVYEEAVRDYEREKNNKKQEENSAGEEVKKFAQY